MLIHRRGRLACAVALALLLGSSARAQAPAWTVSLEGGAAWTQAQSRYLSHDEPAPGAADTDGTSRWGPTGALAVGLTWSLGGALHLGGAAHAAITVGPASPWDDGARARTSIALGPTLRLEPDLATGGGYAGLWVGPALAVASGPAFGGGIGVAGGLDFGYRLPLPEGWALGLGAAIGVRWTFDREEGDHGRYDYEERAVWTTLQVGLARALGS